MNRNNQLIRVLLVKSILEKSRAGLSLGEIHEAIKSRDIKASKRTILRDLEALSLVEIPLVSDRCPNREVVVWRIVTSPDRVLG